MTKTCPACRQRVRVANGSLAVHDGANGMIVCRESGAHYRSATTREAARLASARVVAEGDTRPLPFTVRVTPARAA